ncbi:unnamed protein product [Caenorhabditis auriculariae]|uniref:Peptidase S1 domain-containing protein n=1 Tax=Caenorhabditis auriculariae TaxID=2777116 RepID=A0A8S1GTT6_9PELO|nr:unnamed protein product [Caenorhabditis auriculariae]
MLRSASLLFYLFILFSSSTSFRPIWIGGEFRETSFLTRNDSEDIGLACGFQKDSDRKEFPWAVSFMVDGVNKLGGSIISPYHIITAAHGFMTTLGSGGYPCFSSHYRSIDFLRSTRVIAYGGRCIRGLSKTLRNDPECVKPDVMFTKIRSVLIDGNFALYGCHGGHDWAIVEVEEPMIFSDDVIPICLPTPNMKLKEILTVPGWGRGYIFNQSGPLVHETPMELDPHCKKRPWSDRLPIQADDFLCATSIFPKDYFAPRTCHGDSGSGLEQRDHLDRASLIAMVSFGTGGCPANMLARFTRVDRYLKEICRYTGLCYSFVEE